MLFYVVLINSGLVSRSRPLTDNINRRCSSFASIRCLISIVSVLLDFVQMFEISATDVSNLASDGGIELHVDVF